MWVGVGVGGGCWLVAGVVLGIVDFQIVVVLGVIAYISLATLSWTFGPWCCVGRDILA